ncbi:RDD family protein [Bacillus paralicheniformis]|uniref:RDD domain-containing protein n=1 Tax=Bacillus paralicheniformis TaxID=1648923 RepID=A0ABY3FWR1_9BACI|nr:MULTISPECIES: RDD family protein [Bacillus]ETB73159.1 membrane protein [Bacillus sp. CPSM8]KUL12197.1 membrane protein [Bacillus licheniformis LMG 7559]MBC8623703.1 RDD family protein [Robertmurraya crescens]POO78032.1 RDD family protein [Bacillus sp. MBGLi97]AGN37516.1 putative integral inner membrane protein YteJ [Bacillus paralicheniformis ATCC 9945a]
MDVTYDGKDHNELSPDAGVSREESAPHVEHAYAGFWIRLFAFLLDGIVVGSINKLAVSPVFSLLNLPKESGFFTFSLYSFVTAAVFFAYFVLMTKYFGQTLGKMVFGLRVVSLVPEKGLTWDVILFRELIGRYINSLYITYLVAAFSPKKQGIHDFFADTAVIHEKLYRKKD